MLNTCMMELCWNRRDRFSPGMLQHFRNGKRSSLLAIGTLICAAALAMAEQPIMAPLPEASGTMTTVISPLAKPGQPLMAPMPLSGGTLMTLTPIGGSSPIASRGPHSIRVKPSVEAPETPLSRVLLVTAPRQTSPPETSVSRVLLVTAPRQTSPPEPPPAQPDLPELPAALEETPDEESQRIVGTLADPTQVLEVIVGQSKFLQAKRSFSRILVADPEIADVQLLDQDSEKPRLLNLFGKRFGTTTLAVWDDQDQSVTYKVRVTIDTIDLESRIAQILPGSQVRIRQIGPQIILEGQVPNTQMMGELVQLVAGELRISSGPDGAGGSLTGGMAGGGGGGGGSNLGATAMIALPGVIPGTIINRVRVPGPRQVLLKVKIAEMNRTAMRQLGVSWLDTRNNSMLGSTIGGAASLSVEGGAGQSAAFSPLALLSSPISTALPGRIQAPGFAPVASAFNSAANITNGLNTQLFGVFNAGEFNLFINALRSNSLAKILAEPNLVTLDGQPARFQAGGSFPYPVPQAGAGGVGSVITIQYAEFGAILSFIPHILDGDVIRLDVEPNFSELNFAQGFAIPGTGGTVPGINQRNARTVVELREGQTLAIAGLLSTRTNATTTRIPGLGDLPIVGPWFSSNKIETVETELVVLVTPELVAPIEKSETPPGPGENVLEPTDCEFYFLGRIEGKTGHPYRATVEYQDPLDVMKHFQSEARWVIGPHGHAE